MKMYEIKQMCKIQNKKEQISHFDVTQILNFLNFSFIVLSTALKRQKFVTRKYSWAPNVALPWVP